MAINIALPELKKKKTFIYINAAESGAEKKNLDVQSGWEYLEEGRVHTVVINKNNQLLLFFNLSLLSYSDCSVKLH